jgi:hypothetical protein
MTFDPEANQFNVAWLSAEGWTHNEILAPHSAVLVHARNAEVSVLLTGQVAVSAMLKPSADTRFISTGLAIPQSPAEAGLTVTNGFRAAVSASSASRLRLWAADNDNTSTGYDSLFLMQSGDTSMWVREQSATQNDLTQSPLFEPFYGFFIVP